MTWLRVVDAYKTTTSEGYRQTMPLVHLFGRDTSYQRHHVRIDGFRPYFLVTETEYIEKGGEVVEDDRVLSVETEDRVGRPERAIGGEQLYRIVCREPSDVDDVCTHFDDPYEADVQYDVRFLVDVGAYQWVWVPDQALDSEETVSVDDVEIRVGEGGSSEENPHPSEGENTPPERTPPQ